MFVGGKYDVNYHANFAAATIFTAALDAAAATQTMIGYDHRRFIAQYPAAESSPAPSTPKVGSMGATLMLGLLGASSSA